MKKLLLLTLIAMLTMVIYAEQFTVNDNQNQVNIVSSSSQQTILEMTLGHFNREAVQINNETYWALDLKKEGMTLEAGMPQLPYISRSIIIPGTARMAVNTLESEYIDYVMPIAPSKGNLTRDINPANIPWTFNSFYQSTGSYPEALSRLSEPFIIREYRGITVYFQPFVYYPATHTLRVYTRLRLAVNNTGTDNVNVMSVPKRSASTWFDNIYKGLFLNYGQAKYPIMEEQGRILIINNSMFDATIQPYIDWKRQKGFKVDVVDISVAGPTAAQLKTYIQNQYDLNNDLAFVQIIGDFAQVPAYVGPFGSYTGASDPTLALTAGNDSYPDLFVGRFSAQNPTELETQITRTIYYERDMQSGNLWLAKGLGIASNEGPGDMNESDQAHIENIRTDLLGYGYTQVDQVYQALGASQAMISNGVNDGRSMINYCGHGSDTSWGTTGYSNSQVNQLTNDNKLPFIVSVACVNGNFNNYSACFAEAWLRARDSVTGTPRGAIAFYGSSINQSWNPPMRAQDEIVDLMVANQKNTIGGLYFNGASKMIEVYSNAGIIEYKTWHIFGDASLQIRNTDPLPITAQYSPVMDFGASSYTVQTIPDAWVTLYANGIIYGSTHSDDLGTASLTLNPVPAEPMDITLTITAFNRVTLIDTIEVSPSSGPWIQISNQIITDNNNNRADFGETINFDLTLNNVGSGIANNVIAIISSTDPYITVTDNSESFGNINAGANLTSSSGFAINIASNVYDQYIAPIHVAISHDGVITWEYDIDIIINAPSFTTGAFIIDDSNGNNNGRIDSGELVTLSFPVTNNGHANSSEMQFSLILNNNLNYIITPIQSSFTSVPVDETVQAMYDIAFSSQIPAGTQAEFTLIGISGAYAVSQDYGFNISVMLEDFESGLLNTFPWTFTGGDWTADNIVSHSGSYSAKSAIIGNNGHTQMLINMQIPVTGNITFWKRVSSEATYDYLKFYINDVLQNQWSGNIDWSMESFEVEPGMNNFKWEYMKDNISSGGSDCAWIDDIEFPTIGGTSGTPAIAISADSFNFGEHINGEFTAIPFTITNSGDAVMIGTISGNELFRVKLSTATEYTQSINYIIPGGASLDYEVMMFPLRPGSVNSVLVITSDDSLHLFTNIPINATVLPTANEDNNNPVLVTALKGNYPNPFNPETSISFSLKADSKVTLEIYNLLGQKVRTLANGALKKGNHNLKWNGKDDNDRSVSSGIYFYRMTADNYSSTQKMILMK